MNQNKINKRKKNYYQNYILYDPNKHINSNNYFFGKFRINARNRLHGYVTIEGRKDDIFIFGLKRQNRALEGDNVLVKILDKNIVKELIKTNQSIPKNIIKRQLDFGKVISVIKPLEKRVFIGKLIKPSNSIKDKEIKNKDKKKYEKKEKEKGKGKIITINKKKNNFWKKLDQFLEFKPSDTKAPIILINKFKIPKSYFKNEESLYNNFISVEIDKWPSHSVKPFGKFTNFIGNLDKIITASDSILINCSVDTYDFNDDCINSIPSVSDILNKEEKIRLDLRSQCVFTIDPPTAKDLDDALSFKILENGLYEIGVHIADVSSFIPIGSPLDIEARKRATTVYLVERNIPMLPRLLCDNLCSLSPNEDRLTFSFFYEMDKKGNIHKSYLSKSIINSCAKLSYSDAQTIIEHGYLDQTLLNLRKPEFYPQIIKSILELNNLSKYLYDKRIKEGTLEIGSLKVGFELDEKLMPLSCKLYEPNDANQLIQEFMLLANRSVASILSNSMPNTALLRCHDPPNEKGCKELIKVLKKFSIDTDTIDSFILQKALNMTKNVDIYDAMKMLFIKHMKRAKYLCYDPNSPTNSHHFALSMPLYTHFTSPIRRYADLIVHRQLGSIIRGEDCNYDIDEINEIANHCNCKKDLSRKAQDLSTILFLAHYIIKLSNKEPLNKKKKNSNYGYIIDKALVIDISEDSITLLIKKYGLDTRIHYKNMRLTSYKVKESSVNLEWKPEKVKKHLKTKNESKLNPNKNEKNKLLEVKDDNIVTNQNNNNKLQLSQTEGKNKEWIEYNSLNNFDSQSRVLDNIELKKDINSNSNIENNDSNQTKLKNYKEANQSKINDSKVFDKMMIEKLDSEVPDIIKENKSYKVNQSKYIQVNLDSSTEDTKPIKAKDEISKKQINSNIQRNPDNSRNDNKNQIKKEDIKFDNNLPKEVKGLISNEDNLDEIDLVSNKLKLLEISNNNSTTKLNEFKTHIKSSKLNFDIIDTKFEILKPGKKSIPQSIKIFEYINVKISADVSNFPPNIKIDIVIPEV